MTHETLISPDNQRSPATPAAHGSTRQKAARPAGFTLIEMLVVVIIIAILAGMVLGLHKVGAAWKKKAETVEKLARLRAAVEEFKAEYGKYPPVNETYYGEQPFGYEYAYTTGMCRNVLETYFLPDEPDKPWHKGPIFTFGLMSFLVTRYTDRADNLDIIDPYYVYLLANESQWTDFNASPHGDQARDVAAIDRWKLHIEGITTVGEKLRSTGLFADPGNIGGYTNRYLTVKDGWGKELHYKSPSPYTSYKIWSNGANTHNENGDGDDLSTGAGF